MDEKITIDQNESSVDDCEEKNIHTIHIAYKGDIDIDFLEKEYKLDILEKDDSLLTANTKKICSDEVDFISKQIIDKNLADDVYIETLNNGEENIINENKLNKESNKQDLSFDQNVLDKIDELQVEYPETNLEYGSIENDSAIFLFPDNWIIEGEGELKNIDGNALISFRKLKRDNVDPYIFSKELLQNGEKIEGNLDFEDRVDGSTLIRWFVTDGEKMRQKALITIGERGYLFDANSYTMISDFDIVVNGFFVKN